MVKNAFDIPPSSLCGIKNCLFAMMHPHGDPRNRAVRRGCYAAAACRAGKQRLVETRSAVQQSMERMNPLARARA
jgi:hypothetical protein